MVKGPVSEKIPDQKIDVKNSSQKIDGKNCLIFGFVGANTLCYQYTLAKSIQGHTNSSVYAVAKSCLVSSHPSKAVFIRRFKSS